MPPLQLAVATRCFREPLRQSLQSAANLGVRGVQFDLASELVAGDWSSSALRDFRQLLSELNLQIAVGNFPLRRGLTDEEQLDARILAIKSAMKFAWQIGAPTLNFRVGRIPEDANSPAYRMLQEVLNDLARHGNHVGCLICVTPTWDTPELLAGLLNQVTQGPIGLDFDPANFVMTGQKPIPALRMLHHFVRHVTVRDGVKEIDGSGREVPVGQGDVNWLEMLATLEEIEFTGWATILRTQSDAMLSDLRRAVKTLRL